MRKGGPIFRSLSSQHYKHDVPVLALDKYKPDSNGEDDFSRNLTWFYVYGDDDIAEEFESEFDELMRNRFEDDEIEWTVMTLYPTHVKNEVNPNLRSLFMDVAGESDTNFEQILRRNKTVQESHELDNEKSKVINLEGSIDVERDMEGENVILVDNLVLSGISMLHGANSLKKRGAKNVFGLAIGAKGDTKIPEKNAKASDLISNQP